MLLVTEVLLSPFLERLPKAASQNCMDYRSTDFYPGPPSPRVHGECVGEQRSVARGRERFRFQVYSRIRHKNITKFQRLFLNGPNDAENILRHRPIFLRPDPAQHLQKILDASSCPDPDLGGMLPSHRSANTLDARLSRRIWRYRFRSATLQPNFPECPQSVPTTSPAQSSCALCNYSPV